MSQIVINTDASTHVKEKKLSLKEKVSYGFGDFGNGFMFDLGQIYLLKFFTDVAGIPAVNAGSIFLVSKLFAAITDPIVGSAIDYRKNIGPRGKFRPYLLFGSIVLAVLTVLIFVSPDVSITWKLVYAYASYMLWGVAYSFVNIPYGSLGAAITQDAEDRTALSTFRQIGSLGALLITSVIVIPILVQFNNVHIGYPVVMGMMSVIGVAGFYICYRNCKERIIVHEAPKEKFSFTSVAKTFIINKPLLTLVLMTIFSISAYNIKSAMLVYFAQYNLQNVQLMSYMSFIIIGSSFLGVVFLPKLVKRFGKKQTAMIGFSISIAADLANFFLPANVYLFTILASIAFIGISIPNGITWALVSDIIDYGEWKSGVRKEATTYSLFNFSRKLAQSLSGFLSGVGLSLIGYVPNAAQTADTLTGIKGLLLLYPAIALTCAMLIIGWMYKLTDRQHAEIIKELNSAKTH
ncbi:glycoside-pentoside-hexuronide (GPH):cation symporter [Bacillus atrophaeus]|uniref:glycoside-pentoside-hexuronide (GPH):cation symporter n=1 Tax=Bacillus atrophaeus TaxID=1452 RepID=UPI002280CAF6|nr:glycoside-pentoside-hexuronide (GPH):cation symporter [Bacillus atrophaeus]MCY8959034.1 glycoside-pentoside-hexuronide (GPH):cation symporter [Bacillus atrophaeus]MCY8964609.1 glycoside-pentoside-hexuronide (GPH):cation symporter [Bacillus atrophaeus]MCY9436651.1 glycoside-pentoside-hexuronide (GPH):cation symporter [Bacillus atrophaeus]MEC0649227.1 glycoside-pentoside-hexuronide (GPH):cation symporter [Bacillus atrophaeus]